MAASTALALPGDAPTYERHRPEPTRLYALIEEHFPRFLERLDAEGVSLPHFVIEELLFPALPRGIAPRFGRIIPTTDCLGVRQANWCQCSR